MIPQAPGNYWYIQAGLPTGFFGGLSTGCFVVRTMKGPVDKPYIVTNWVEFTKLYGGFYKDWIGPLEIDLFYKLVGNCPMRVLRVANTLPGTPAVAAKNETIYNYVNHALADYLTQKIYAGKDSSNLNYGAWGNAISILSTKAQALTTAQITTGLFEAVVDDVSPFEKGDVIKIENNESFIAPHIWVGLAAHVVGEYVVPTTGVTKFFYKCTAGPGNSAAGEPVWPTTPGTTVVDGTVTWMCCFKDIFAVIADVDPATKKIKFTKYKEPSTLPIGGKVTTASQHRGMTTLSEALTITSWSGDSIKVKLTDAANFKLGQIITVVDSTGALAGESKYLTWGGIVSSVNGNELTVDASTSTLGTMNDALPGGLPTPPITFPVNSLVCSQEFLLTEYSGTEPIKSHQFLSVISENLEDYVEVRLNNIGNEANESDNIYVDDVVTYVNILLRPPAPDVQWSLAGGHDGLEPTDAQIVSALALLDGYKDIEYIGAPARGDTTTTATVNQGGVDYCAGDTRKSWIGCLGANATAFATAEAIRNWRKYTLNRYSYNGTIYAPWIEIADPTRLEKSIWVSPVGAAMAHWAYRDLHEGPHWAPANIRFDQLKDVSLTISDSWAGILNEEGVNMFRYYQDHGVRLMGARTLRREQDALRWINITRILYRIQTAVDDVAFDINFHPNESSTWSEVERAVDRILNALWRDGWLVPKNNKRDAYYVYCNDETNPAASVELGDLTCNFGFNGAPPAERCKFYVQVTASKNVLVGLA